MLDAGPPKLLNSRDVQDVPEIAEHWRKASPLQMCVQAISVVYTGIA